MPCHPWCTHRTSLVVKKNFFNFSVAVNNSIKVGPINVCNHREHYEMPCTVLLSFSPEEELQIVKNDVLKFPVLHDTQHNFL